MTTKRTQYPIASKLGGIDVPMLTDAEEMRLMEIIAKDRAEQLKSLPMISSVEASWQRGFNKGHSAGVMAVYREYPALGREVIERNS